MLKLSTAPLRRSLLHAVATTSSSFNYRLFSGHPRLKDAETESIKQPLSNRDDSNTSHGVNGVHILNQQQLVNPSDDILEETSPNAVLSDRYGRFHNYLRISLTEKCNLRCTYCMPEEGIDLTPQNELLTTEELLRICKIFTQYGVDKVRFTGGEPTVRRDLVEIMREVKSYGVKKIAMTTNGIVLKRKLPDLVDAGLNLVNISLDTLDPFKFELITRRKGHSRVLAAIDAVLEAGIDPPKVNCVITRQSNKDEILDFVEMTEHKNIEIRFIEYMPFDGNKWDDKKMVSYAEMLDIIGTRYVLERQKDHPNDTSKTFKVPGFEGRVGFITSMTKNFCSSCNRLRMTADGNLKVCLFGPNETSLRDKIREGATDDDLAEIIGAAVLRKKKRHAGMHNIASMKNRPMITIGG